MTFLGRFCGACGRNIDRDPWPYAGIPCGHCDLQTLEPRLDPDDPALALARGWAR